MSQPQAADDIVTVRDFIEQVNETSAACIPHCNPTNIEYHETALEYGQLALAAFERIVADRRALAQGNAASDVIAEISAERQRQVSAEGWSPEHDDEHSDGALADAAACYAISPAGRQRYISSLDGPSHWPPNVWPFDYEWWKPKSRRRDLVRAAALIVAEIERLDRASAPDEIARAQTQGEG